MFQHSIVLYHCMSWIYCYRIFSRQVCMHHTSRHGIPECNRWYSIGLAYMFARFVQSTAFCPLVRRCICPLGTPFRRSVYCSKCHSSNSEWFGHRIGFRDWVRRRKFHFGMPSGMSLYRSMCCFGSFGAFDHRIGFRYLSSNRRKHHPDSSLGKFGYLPISYLGISGRFFRCTFWHRSDRILCCRGLRFCSNDLWHHRFPLNCHGIGFLRKSGIRCIRHSCSSQDRWCFSIRHWCISAQVCQRIVLRLLVRRCMCRPCMRFHKRVNRPIGHLCRSVRVYRCIFCRFLCICSCLWFCHTAILRMMNRRDKNRLARKPPCMWSSRRICLLQYRKLSR